MNVKILKVSGNKYRNNYFPRIKLSAFWLNDIGFNRGSLIKLDYSMKNIILRLHDTTVDNFQNISDEIVLLKVNHELNKNKDKVIPTIKTYGKWLAEIGFVVGDKILVEYTHGLINIKPYNEV